MNREELFDELFRSHHRAILHYLQRRLEAEDAADVAAEVFVVAWRRLERIPEDAALLWLYGVAHRALANHRRSVRRRDRLVADWAEALRRSTPPDAPAPPVIEVREALAALPGVEREVLTLSVWEGLNAAEIAQVVGSTPGAVRVRLHRARRKLHVRLDRGHSRASCTTSAEAAAG